jgi:polyphenol oxidase
MRASRYPCAMMEPWTIPADWPAPARVHALATTRCGPGVSVGVHAAFNLGEQCGDSAEAVQANRARLCESLALPREPRWLRQVHGCDVACFDDGNEVAAVTADAATSALPGTVLAVTTADCLPVLFCASDGSEIAAAHAGWRGLAAGVLEATVAAMRKPAHEIMAWMGPAIGPLRYEVGAEVREAFRAHDARATSAFVESRPGHWRCDLYALARQRLAACGMTQVHGGGLCTYSDPERFYSYRRDGASGRMASLIWMDPD